MTFENNQEIMDMCMDYARESGMGPYYLYRQKNMSGEPGERRDMHDRLTKPADCQYPDHGGEAVRSSAAGCR